MSDENQNDENQNEESNIPENSNEENQNEETDNQENNNEENQNEETSDHEGHDHEGHDHESHDHESHDHESHDHENDSTRQDESADTTETVEDQAKETVDEIKEGWNEATKGGENKKLLAGILGIVLGSFGVHKFILGYNKEGMILLGLTLVGIATSCLFFGIFLYMAAAIVGLVEGIIYLTKSDEEFYETYQANKKPWF
jgi:TM2 domain-containing membrane protein YozV